MIVAESDVLIDALNGREPATSRVAEEVRRASLATTSISVFELLSGAREDRHRESVSRLLAALTILPVDGDAGTAAAAARRTLEAQGLGIGLADYLIAGVCLTHSAPLLTRNRDHFQRVPGILLAPLG